MMNTVDKTANEKTVEEAAKEWGVIPRYVRQLCKEGRVPGAYRCDDSTGSWRLPKDATRPPSKIRRNKIRLRPKNNI